jgi:hypothetical protein
MYPMFLASIIYFIACHGGPADHFATFAEELCQRGHTVQIYATGPALKKCQERNKDLTIPFSLEDASEEEIADRIALGYYPTAQAEKIGARRKHEHNALRAHLFAKYSLIDRGQKILVYAGGNNEEYFTKAFPAFLELLGQIDLSQTIVLLQQHPGAKEKNRDGKLVHAWNGKTAPFLISELTTDDAQVVADVMLYYQTSMGPQFVLAGIPTIQVGHEVYEDILVRNGLCHTATTADALTYALSHLNVDIDETQILDRLGISPDWASHLEAVLKPSFH